MNIRKAYLTGSAVALALAASTAPTHAAHQFYNIDFQELNSSGVSGSGFLVYIPPANTLRVSYTVMGLDAGVHPQHIHGLLDAGPGSMAGDSTTPTLANDSDMDGFLETVEGVPAYGDVLLTLFNMPGNPATLPVTDMSGVLAYDVTFDLSDPSIFLPSPATGITYGMADLLPLEFREIVIHGADVAAGVGGGMFEVDGTQAAGFVPLLPVAAAEITRAVPEPTALSLLAIGAVALYRRQRAG